MRERIGEILGREHQETGGIIPESLAPLLEYAKEVGEKEGKAVAESLRELIKEIPSQEAILRDILPIGDDVNIHYRSEAEGPIGLMEKSPLSDGGQNKNFQIKFNTEHLNSLSRLLREGGRYGRYAAPYAFRHFFAHEMYHVRQHIRFPEVSEKEQERINKDHNLRLSAKNMKG
jgi:hypothetical protein